MTVHQFIRFIFPKVNFIRHRGFLIVLFAIISTMACSTTAGADDWDNKRIIDSYEIFCDELMAAAEAAERGSYYDEAWVSEALIPGDWIIRFIEETKEYEKPPAIRVRWSIIVNGLDFTQLAAVPVEQTTVMEGMTENDKRDFLTLQRHFFVDTSAAVCYGWSNRAHRTSKGATECLQKYHMPHRVGTQFHGQTKPPQAARFLGRIWAGNHSNRRLVIA